MYNKLERLENKAGMARQDLDRLKAQHAQAEAAAIANPTEGAVLEAATLEMKIKIATRTAEAAQAELQAEIDRLNSPEAKKALKRLDKVNGEGLALTKEITAELEVLHGKMTEWEALQKEARSLADQYNGKAFDLGIAGSRLGSVKKAITFWLQEIRSWKRAEEIAAMPGKGVVPVKQPDTPERRRMLKERYPKPGER